MSTEDDIAAFLEEIQKVTNNLRNLTSTVAAGEEALAKALGIDTKAVKENSKALEQNTGEIKKETQTRREIYEQNKREIHQKRRDRDVVTDLMREFGQGTTTTQVLRQQFEKGSDSAKILSAAFEGLYKSTMQYASALYRGERGMLVAAKAATTATKPLIELGEAVGTAITVLSFFLPAARAARLLGLALFGAAKAVGLVNDLNEKAAEQTDRLFKSFVELGRSGVMLQGGMGNVFEMAQTMGLTVTELEEFNRLLVQNSQNLALIGGTAGRGAEQFAEISGRLVKDLGRDLEIMGISRDEQRELTLGFLQLQARSGRMNYKTFEEASRASAAYIRELDQLAELTGTSRKAQQEAREAAMAETRFRAARIAAEQEGDEELTRRLDIAQRAAAFARAAGDTRGFTGILQAATGYMTTAESVAAQQTYRLEELFARGEVTDAQIGQHLGDSVKLQQQQLARTIMLSGNIEMLTTDFTKSADLQAQQAALAREAAEKGMSIDQYIAEIRAGREAGSEETRRFVDATRAQQNAALSMDGVVRSFANAGNTFKSATDVFANAVKRMPGARPGGLTTGGAAPGGAAPGGAAPGGAAPGGAAPGGAATAIGDLASKIVRAEGGTVTARNPYSSASGLGQITRGRYQDLVKESRIGSALYGTTFEQYQGSESLQREALNAQVENLRSYLASRGLSTTDAAVYMAHVFGPAGARAVLTHADSVPVTSLFNEDIISKNPAIFNGVKTVGDLKKVVSNKMGGSGYQFGGIATGPTSGYLAQLHGAEAVVPLTGDRKIPVDLSGMGDAFERVFGPQIQAMSAQIERLDDLVDLMRRQNSTSEKILQVSQS